MATDNFPGLPISSDPELMELLLQTPSHELARILSSLPPGVTENLLDEMARLEETLKVENTPLPKHVVEQAQLLEPTYVSRPHLDYLAGKLAEALERVEQGENVHLTVSMPPRTGKSFSVSTFTPTWVLNRHPDWNIGLISHSPMLASSWGRANRRLIEQHGKGAGGSGLLANLELAKDARAVSHWETARGGSLLSRSVRQALAGFGFKMLVVDDAVKDIASATNPKYRDDMWNWWKADVISRMQPPYLLIVVGTRWHEDDLIGRILSDEHEGDPSVWEQITFPALATEETVDPVTGRDILGRKPGDPLISPLIADETREQALVRWATLEANVGSYYWSALYQQRPSPESGGIFDLSKIRFWTNDPSYSVPEEGSNVVYLDSALLDKWKRGTWLDSWDTSFKGTETSDWVVGQRWVRTKADRYLIAQQRGRWGYTGTMERMKQWGEPGSDLLSDDSPFGRYVHQTHIEETANGPALIEKLGKHVSGVKGINPRMSKEARARVITPEIESGHVYLPHPDMPGYAWVTSLLSEMRNFPRDKHDDQVDSLTQALLGLRDPNSGSITVPGGLVERNPLETYKNSRNLATGRGATPGRALRRSPLAGRSIR